ncbi:hypothetical protein Glove_103g294 [Diversispora epigaea]|uniref:Uncharacterized protein n=1 Tax=Diversispora epigaea TaxID=1348612 RepID=A0A397J5W6_9GLOM|nr:hypothetical protein Glove_103g294 [Diversispora epigaea]
MKEIFLQEVLEVEKRNIKGRRALGIVRTTIKELSEKKKKRRFNRTLVDSLSKVSEDVTDWDKHIPSVLFAYRIAKQATTKIEPFYLVYGRAAQFPMKFGIFLINYYCSFQISAIM